MSRHCTVSDRAGQCVGGQLLGHQVGRRCIAEAIALRRSLASTSRGLCQPHAGTEGPATLTLNTCDAALALKSSRTKSVCRSPINKAMQNCTGGVKWHARACHGGRACGSTTLTVPRPELGLLPSATAEGRRHRAFASMHRPCPGLTIAKNGAENSRHVNRALPVGMPSAPWQLVCLRLHCINMLREAWLCVPRC